MFTLPYVWFYIFVKFFSFILLRYGQRMSGERDTLKTIITLEGSIMTLAGDVFLVLGFWFMPHWWYPLALFGLGFAAPLIPISDNIAATIGIIAGPVLTILMYINLFV